MKYLLLAILITVTTASPAVVLASIDNDLWDVYETRSDLQVAFDSDSGLAVPGTAAGFLLDLEDWAKQYGWQEHEELLAYAPEEGSASPVRISMDEIESEIGSHGYIVLDRQTGQVLTVKQENRQWPIASLTKLVTAQVVTNAGVPLTDIQSVLSSDNVGGARLWVESGDTFTVRDLYYATLVGSANNAANALARSTGLSLNEFVVEMNDWAEGMNLTHTAFVDPTGIELGNVSTLREVARIAMEVFKNEDIRKYTQTYTKYITVLNQDTEKKLTNTNWMLWKPDYDDVYVMSGKTGYLIESKWNLVVSLRPELYDSDRELLIVIFGAESRSDSFIDARTLADWAWDVHEWEDVEEI